jgi:hypothetical protein
MAPTMDEVLAMANAALDRVKDWKRDMSEADPKVVPHKMRAFVGTAGGWHFVITDFSIEAQGFPEGSRGVDGAARNDPEGIVLHLTRELAQKGLDLALGATGNN